jgi:cellulose synthase/poly-beta-1,6-N-acetylglucosamine synthase-like glycosyltransferase
MSFFPSDLSWTRTLLLGTFLVPVTILNIYALAVAVNILRAVISTRFFTNKPKQGGFVGEGDEPVVTIQICVYNEASVIEETLNAACSIDWPRDKLFVQVLDDSSDETTAIIHAVVANYYSKGVNCKRFDRPDRVGYKAGNLHSHTHRIEGDFVALFDADHRCDRQFLRRTVPHFFDNKGMRNNVGLVQVPWAYYNIHQNMLTEYDCLNLDVSHVISQTGRSEALKCFGFNGTGGIWNKGAIRAGGGWTWDTVTEDLDLSYKAHLAGYDFVYLRDVPQQLEVPAGIRAHVQQKHRWTKGFFQVARKSLWKILRAPRANSSLALKFEVFFHMTAPITNTLALLVMLFVPVLSFHNLITPGILWYTVAGALVPLIAGICTVYGKHSGQDKHYKTFLQRSTRLLYLPTLFMIAFGMMVFETYAVFDGLFSNDATFLRTPKEGTLSKHEVIRAAGIDYVDQDDEDLDENLATPGKNTERMGNTVAKKACKSSLDTTRQKKRWKFFFDLQKGMSGFLVAIYNITWTVILFRQKNAGSVDGIPTYNFGELTAVFIPLLPALGLSYVHGIYIHSLLSSKYSKWQKKKIMTTSRNLKTRMLGDMDATGKGSNDDNESLSSSPQKLSSTDDDEISYQC